MAGVKTIAEALKRVDELVAQELVGVVKDLIGISHESDDDRARVSAATKVLDYARPPKGMQVNISNQVGVVSHLNLPQGRLRQKNPKAHEGVDRPHANRPKILPESNPLHRSKFVGNFSAANPQQPAIPVAATPQKLLPRSKTPHAPDMPPSASTIRPAE